jgi:tetratricopeptide (TPR) repeat protein
MEVPQPPPELFECDRCKRTSTIEAVFIRKKRLDGSLSSSRCFECESRSQVNSLLVLYTFLLIFAWIDFNLAPGSWIGNFSLYLFWGLLTSIPLLVLHELAHALAALLLGFRVFAIHLGMGKTLLSTRFLDVTWVIHPAPISAVTILAGPDMPYYRLRIFIITLAGPIFHAGLAGGLFLADGIFNFTGLWYPILLWTNILLFVVNIFPRKALVAVGPAGTDGLSLLQIPRMNRDELQKKFASYYLLETLAQVDKGNEQKALRFAEQGAALYPDDPNALNGLGYARIYTRDHAQSKEVFEKALALKEKQIPLMEMILHNNVAFANLILDDPSLLSEADAYSDKAFQALSWEPAIMGTRGGVLVALDRPEEGLVLLKKAMAQIPEKRGKAMDACLIAWGESKLGRQDEARKYLALARQIDPQCPLLDFATRKMEADHARP